MAKPTRFTQDMYDEYFSKGLWTMDTTSDIWDENAGNIRKRKPL